MEVVSCCMHVCLLRRDREFKDGKAFAFLARTTGNENHKRTQKKGIALAMVSI